MPAVSCRAWWISVVAAAATVAWAAEPAPPRLLTGRALELRLNDQLGVSWSAANLRDVVTSFSRNAQVAIVLDRRVDPDRPVNFSASALSVREILEQLAHRHGLEIAWLGATAYLGPAETAAKLSAVAAMRRGELASLPTSLKSALLAERPLAWNDLTEPRTLVERLAADANLRVANLDVVPFDLWYRGATAPLSLFDRLTLVAVEFDLTYKIDGVRKTLTLVPLPNDIPAATAAAPKIAPPSNSKPAKSTAPGTQVFTLRIKDVPFSQLLNVLREKHNLKIDVDVEAVRAAGLSLDERTSIAVERVTLEQLLDKAAAPLGLAAKQSGDAVRIGPRTK